MKAENVALIGFILLSIVSGWVLYYLITEERAGVSWFEASKVVTIGFTDGWSENQGNAGTGEQLIAGAGGALSSLAAAYGGPPLFFLFSAALGIALWSYLLIHHYSVIIGLRRLHYFSLWQSSDWRVQKKVFSTVDKAWTPLFLYAILGGLAVTFTHGLLYDLFYLVTALNSN